MDVHKIENYEREHGSGSFPPFSALSPGQRRHLAQRLSLHIERSQNEDESDLLHRLLSNTRKVMGVDAASDSFSFQHLLTELRLPGAGTVFLNWGRFDHVDAIELGVLTQWFDDIWYPAADDLEIIDERFRWVIAVRHDGAVYFGWLSSQP